MAKIEIKTTQIDMTGWSEELAVDREIDAEGLDTCALAQADLFCKWAERSSIAHSDLEDLQFQADTVEAQLYVRLREDPSKFGMQAAPTVQQGKAAVESHPTYIKAHEALLVIRRIVGFCDVAVNAMEMRKRMLELEGRLHAQMWFAGPSIPRNLADEWKKHRKQRETRMSDMEERQNELLNRRK